jgi:hypothetical protein
MAITTVNQLITKTLPRFRFNKSLTTAVSAHYQDTWTKTGFPVAGTFDITTVGGVTFSGNSNFSIYAPNPITGTSYFSKMCFGSTVSHGILICDRIWSCGVVSAGTAFSVTDINPQTVNSVTWPARDDNGSTNGEGIYIGVQPLTVLGAFAGTGDITLTYTNSAGTAGRTATLSRVIQPSLAINMLIPFGLQEGDLGVRSVQSIQLSQSLLSGTIGLVAFRPITFCAAVDLDNIVQKNYDGIAVGMPTIPSNAVLFLLPFCTTTTSVNISGYYDIAQG